MFVFLKEDVRSCSTRKGKEFLLYGAKGDLVKIISVSEPVLIVEGKNGERFAVRREKTSAEKEVEVEAVVEKKEYKPMDLSDWQPEKIDIPKPKPIKVAAPAKTKKAVTPKPQQGSLW
jgi:hypothetical protein